MARDGVRDPCAGRGWRWKCDYHGVHTVFPSVSFLMGHDGDSLLAILPLAGLSYWQYIFAYAADSDCVLHIRTGLGHQ